MEPEGSLPHSRSISPGPRLTVGMFRNMIRFYGVQLLAPRPTPKLKDHPLPAVRDCLFNIFATNLHIGGRSSIRNLRTRRAVVTGTHLLRVHTRRRSKQYKIQIHLSLSYYGFYVNVGTSVIKSRIRWDVHVARMGARRGVYRVLVRELEGKRPLGRARCR